MSEVRGRSREEPMPKGKWPRGVTHHPRSGAAAKSARLPRRRNSLEVLPHARGQGPQPRGATPPPRSGACMGTGGPRGAIPCSRSEGAEVRRYPTSKVRSSGCAMLSSSEGIPRVQGKRNPSKMVGVARGHQRVDTLQPYSQKTSQSNHTRMGGSW